MVSFEITIQFIFFIIYNIIIIYNLYIVTIAKPYVAGDSQHSS